MAMLRHIPACPPEFADQFVTGGWRKVERIYNARTDLLLKWIEMSGGAELYRRRKEHLKANNPRGPSGGNLGRSRGVQVVGWLDR
jgi:hypothetical protein